MYFYDLGLYDDDRHEKSSSFIRVIEALEPDFIGETVSLGDRCDNCLFTTYKTRLGKILGYCKTDHKNHREIAWLADESK